MTDPLIDLEERLCRFCGCCSARDDGLPGCIGTIVGGSHDGAEFIMFSGYARMRGEMRTVRELERVGWGYYLDPMIHSFALFDAMRRRRAALQPFTSKEEER